MTHQQKRRQDERGSSEHLGVTIRAVRGSRVGRLRRGPLRFRSSQGVRRSAFLSVRMTLAGFVVMSLFCLLSAERVAAQVVVQLPTWRTFSVNSSVWVPDRGGALLGGVATGRAGSVQRGVPLLGNVPLAGRPFRQRAIGSEFTTGSASVRATIIDLRELDRKVLAEAARRRAARAADSRFDSPRPVDPELERQAEFLSRHLGKSRGQRRPDR